MIVATTPRSTTDKSTTIIGLPKEKVLQKRQRELDKENNKLKEIKEKEGKVTILNKRVAALLSELSKSRESKLETKEKMEELAKEVVQLENEVVKLENEVEIGKDAYRELWHNYYDKERKLKNKANFKTLACKNRNRKLTEQIKKLQHTPDRPKTTTTTAETRISAKKAKERAQNNKRIVDGIKANRPKTAANNRPKTVDKSKTADKPIKFADLPSWAKTVKTVKKPQMNELLRVKLIF